MINIRTRDEFRNAIIAQDDDNDYEESGYVVLNVGKEYAIARYGHCSCYGTWTSILGGSYNDSGVQVTEKGIIWDWTGSLRQLLKLARNKLDPHCSIGSRKADEKDYDYDHLMACYTQILEWNEKRRKKKQ